MKSTLDYKPLRHKPNKFVSSTKSIALLSTAHSLEHVYGSKTNITTNKSVKFRLNPSEPASVKPFEDHLDNLDNKDLLI